MPKFTVSVSIDYEIEADSIEDAENRVTELLSAEDFGSATLTILEAK